MFLNLTKVAAFIAMVFVFSSCLKNQGNYQRFSNLTGSVVYYNGLPVVKIDNSGFIYADEFQKYELGDRLVVSFKIDYDNQPSGSTIYTATEVAAMKFDRKVALNVPAIAADTLKNDTILNVNACFLSEYKSQVLLTISSSFYASNDYHRMYIAKYNELQTSNDTLRLEYRHNGVNDGERTKVRTNLTSFDISEYFGMMSEGDSKIIEVKFKNASRPIYRIKFIKPTESIN